MSSSPNSSSSSSAASGSLPRTSASAAPAPAGVYPEASEGFGPLQDVMCGVAVVLGTGRMSVRQCLYLTPRTVIPLDQPAGADLHVHVNGIPVASGEVVIVEDSTALRLTRILAPPHAEGNA